MCGCNKAKAAAAAAARNRQAVGGSVEVESFVAVPMAATLETVDTSVWGPPLWKILHIAAYRTNSRRVVPLWRMVLGSMTSGLPCPDCSEHYRRWYNGRPLRIGLMPNMFRGAIIGWLNDLHNDVNQRTGKDRWSPQQVAATYGGESIATAKALVDSLNGIIGDNLSKNLSALLRAL